ncbi:MAG TPA: NYN domain-containing protein [Thermomicrobiales bacterium]|nr:NYN domain-containing protein [Thermomicrobiales bacterium]
MYPEGEPPQPLRRLAAKPPSEGGGFCLLPHNSSPRRQTTLYVDGFNLYYRLVRRTPYKWLNVKRLAELIVKDADVQAIHYFTARATARPSDPYVPARQEVYFRALRTLPNLTIHEGKFTTHPTFMPLAHPGPGDPDTVEVLRTEEKGSDVNLATRLLIDAFEKRFEQAVVLSNDSDLASPIQYVVSTLNLPVIVLAPEKQPSKELRRVATLQMPVRKGPLRASQFPRQLTASNGRLITKPHRW